MKYINLPFLYLFILLIAQQLTAQSHNDSLHSPQKLQIETLHQRISEFKGERPKIGLVLAGGGAKGFAHIGVIQLLDSLGIPVDYIAGTSMGGLVAALYSIGYDGKELEKFATELDWGGLLSDDPPRQELPFIEKEKSGKYQLKLGLKGATPSLPSGLIDGQNIHLLFSSMTSPFEDLNEFDKLPIPFQCVAVDLVTGNEVVLKKGSLAKAMRATMSIPTVFSPVDWGDSLLVDGGVLNNFPVDVVKDMGADIIIGLNLTTGVKEKKDFDNFLTILDRTSDIPTGATKEKNIALCDVYILQDLKGYSTGDFTSEKLVQIIERGRIAGKENLDLFVELKNSLIKYNDYNQWIEKTKVERDNKTNELVEKYKTDPPYIHGLKIKGNENLSFNFIYTNLGIRPGELFDTKVINKKIELLYALGYFNSITYDVEKIDEESIELIIEVKEKPSNNFILGFRYDDYFKLVGLVGAEANSVLLYGGQFQTYLYFGSLTKFSLRMMYPSKSMSMPLYPFLSVEYKDIPLDFYQGDQKILSYWNSSWMFSLGLNLSLSKFWNLETGAYMEFMNVSENVSQIDFDQIHNTRARIIKLKFDLIYDSLDDVLLPNSGVYFKSYYVYSSETLGSDLNYTKLYSKLDFYLPFGESHNLGFTGSYMKAWRDVPFYKWFYIGGPGSFIGIEYYKAIGTEFTIGGFDYRYKLADNLYLKGMFNIMFNYNLGTPSNPYRGEPIIGYGVSLKYSTLLGVFEIVLSRGDKDMHNPGEKEYESYFVFGFRF